MLKKDTFNSEPVCSVEIIYLIKRETCKNMYYKNRKTYYRNIFYSKIIFLYS